LDPPPGERALPPEAWPALALRRVRASAVVRSLGAFRFEQPCLLFLGLLSLDTGHRERAASYLVQALDVAERTGVEFWGPTVHCALALTLTDPEERGRSLDDGEAALLRGCVGHNHLLFYPLAMETALELGDAPRVSHYRGGLARATREEPLHWARFFIDRAGALWDAQQDPTGSGWRAPLEALRGRAHEYQYNQATVKIEQALEGATES